MKYHVNSNGEAGLCSATKGKCPFGSEDKHFTSADAARSAFEQTQNSGLAGSKKNRAFVIPEFLTPPTTRNDFDKALALIPTVSSSQVIAEPAIADNNGYLGGRRYVGAEREKLGRYVGQAEAAEGVKALIKKAKDLGELPKWLDVSVKRNSGAGVSSFSVTVGYKPEGGRKVKALPDEWLHEARADLTRRPKIRQPIEKLQDYVKNMSRQYEESDNNGQVDYYSHSGDGKFEWRESWYEDSYLTSAMLS